MTATFVVSREDTHQCGIYLAKSLTGHILGFFAGCTNEHNNIIESVQFINICLNNQDLSKNMLQI
jgi:hypothetical protein